MRSQVTDFGISTRFGRADYTAETGTYRQMAPEVILHKPYNYKCDVYSYGGKQALGAKPLSLSLEREEEPDRDQIAQRRASLLLAC